MAAFYRGDDGLWEGTISYNRDGLTSFVVERRRDAMHEAKASCKRKGKRLTILREYDTVALTRMHNVDFVCGERAKQPQDEGGEESE